MCIFEINYFSLASFAIMFSHSEGCLFTLLMQKLLSLIRSHLLIFAFISIILEKAMAPPLQYSCLENPVDRGVW